MVEEREEKERQLKILWWLYLGGRIDLYFGDESAFSMNPKLPYGWSKKGERIQIFPQRDKKVNLFGVFRPDNFCVTYESDGNINADFLIRSINDFCRYIKKPTVLVLDNAPTHRSRKFIKEDVNTGFRAVALKPVDLNDKRVIVAFSGSDEGKDWGDNIKQGIGLSTEQYGEAVGFANKWKASDGGSVILTGHSLGGGLALRLRLKPICTQRR